ncbi:MAG TPA: copper chaperone PCu(A)C [Burkholderiales bacterium]|nr:copper chaperone PCu(A)C [Burkholderiales bacterium]
MNPSSLKRYRRGLLALLFAAGIALAAEPVTVTDPWVRATAPGQNVAGAYMELNSPGGASLLSAASPAAGVVELHTMKMEEGVMKMRAVPRIELPAGKGVKLAPGGYHLMLMDLKQQLNPGDTVPITLTVEGSDKAKSSLAVKAQVREVKAGSEHHKP